MLARFLLTIERLRLGDMIRLTATGRWNWVMRPGERLGGARFLGERLGGAIVWCQILMAISCELSICAYLSDLLLPRFGGAAIG